MPAKEAKGENRMRRWLVYASLLVAALTFAAVATAHGKPNPKKQPHPNKVRTVIHTTDGGCAGYGPGYRRDYL